MEASKELDGVFARQVSEDVPAYRVRLAKAAAEDAPRAAAALRYFDVMTGPWDRLRGDEPFVGRRLKPPGAGFYPPDMTKDEFEKWIAAHPSDKESFQGLFTVIRRDGWRLVSVPYSKEYGAALTRAAAKLREAAAATANASLRSFLTKRADAFLSDDYFASDVAWMDLDSDIEIAIGPYEVYEDGLFNYKAAFESFVTVRDKAESAHLAVYAQHLPDMEKNLPIPDEHKNFSRKFESPIRVVQEVFTSADARRGVQTSAFNLPNDERVREAKGSKKVLLKNVMEREVRAERTARRRAGARPFASGERRPSSRTSTTRSFTSCLTGSGPGSSPARTASASKPGCCSRTSIRRSRKRRRTSAACGTSCTGSTRSG